MCLVHFQEEVLKLVEETELFKHLNRWLASEISSCKSLISFGFNENTVFHMKLSLLDQTCRKETNLTLAKADGAKPMTLVSGKIRTNGIDQGIDMLLHGSFISNQSIEKFAASFNSRHSDTTCIGAASTYMGRN